MDATNSVISSVQRKTPTKRSKPKKKPIKVVYIANPMKVNTSASEFRALVQELTGRDAGPPPNPLRYLDHGGIYGGDGGGSGHQIELPKNCVTKNNGDEENDDDSNNSISNGDSLGMMIPRVEAKDVEWFEPLDEADIFAAEMMMMENVSALLQPAGAMYEPAQVDQVLRSLHAL